jgi:hypothetical protein
LKGSRKTLALSLSGLLMACGSSRKAGELPKKAPRVDSWQAIKYLPQPRDGGMSGVQDDAEAQAITKGLAARHGEAFEVTWVSTETYSAPGWPGGGVGRFEAYPSARPELKFGGFNGKELVDNFDCIRAVEPLAAWVGEQDAFSALQVEHPCLRHDRRDAAMSLWVFDDSLRSPDELVEVVRKWITPQLAESTESNYPLDGLTVFVSQHPPGAGPTVAKVVGTTRRPEHARNAARRREVFASALRWKAGAWSREDETPSHVRILEERVAQQIAPEKPEGVVLEVERLGPPGASIDDIARRPNTREMVRVHLRIDGDFDTTQLAQWFVKAQNSIDSRLLLYWRVTLCSEGAARPWADPAQCQAGWDDFTVFTLDHEREAPDFWPYPPAAD